MRILLTGNPGIGKTTAIRGTLRNLQGVKCAGFYTEER
ncbi:MAG: nucleoside-triphosphatase, partial [Candidatus Binatia bacterium]